MPPTIYFHYLERCGEKDSVDRTYLRSLYFVQVSSNLVTDSCSLNDFALIYVTLNG